MAVPKPPKTLLRWAGALLALLPIAALVGCTRSQYPQSSLHPMSDYAWAIQHLLDQLVFWVVVIFVLVEGALIFTLVRFRARPGAPDPKPVHGHTLAEIAWTIAPTVILALVAVPTVMAIFRTQAPAPKGAIEIKVIGHQWWWEFQYPDLNVTTASDMHIPVGKPVVVRLSSIDVIHSFWFPAMGGKRDAVPNHDNFFWFTADSTGTYPGQCAELCGTSHANMRMHLVVESPEAFDAWVAQQHGGPAEPADTTSLAYHGKQTFLEAGCIACHAITGVAEGTIGPNLTHLASRLSIAGAIYDNTPENLAKWITDPPTRKPGSLMPNLGLTPDQVNALVAYLTTLQ